MATKKDEAVWSGPEGLRPLLFPLPTLVHDPVNARTHPPGQIDHLRASLREFGQRKPIVVQKEGLIIRAGNGMATAAKAEGWSHIAAVVVDEDTLSATRFALTDNQTGDLSAFDDSVLADLLRGMEDSPPAGFSEDDLAKILAETGDGGTTPGEVPFSEVLGEQNNYIVLFFRTEIDWLSAQTHFDLKTVKAKRANGKPWSRGIGRVLDGAEVLRKLTGGL